MARAMSDPVTNVEIEDVLSSIRRLVSEDARPRRSPEVQPVDRLVLSPALRVADEQDAASAPDPADSEETGSPGAETDSGEPPIVLTMPAAEGRTGLVPDGVDSDPVQTDLMPEASFVLEPENRAEPDTSEPQDEEVFGAAATLAEEQDAVLLAQATADDRDPSVDPAADTKAEADQLAALRASLTDILIPEPEMDRTEPVDPPSEDVQAWSEDGEPTLLDGDAELTDGEVSLERKIAALQSLLHQNAQGSGPAGAADPQPSSMDTFEAFEAERDAPDSAFVGPQDAETADPASAEDNRGLDADAIELTDGGQMDQQHPDDASFVAASEPEADSAAMADGAVTAEAGKTSEPVDVDADSSNPLDSDPSDPLDSQPDADDVVDHQPDPFAETTDEAAAGAAFLRHATALPLDWEDHVPGAEAEPEAAAVPPAERESDSVPAELDEEALQALVANIVRQELQGVLGERITRNVRKLVRREIHRVLMSKDLD